MTTGQRAEALVENLVAGLKPTPWFRLPGTIFAAYSIVSFTYFGLLLGLANSGAGPAPTGHFSWAYVAFLSALSLAPWIAAFRESNPGRAGSAALRLAPFVLLAAWVVLIAVRHELQSAVPAPSARGPDHEDAGCFRLIVLYSILPTALQFVCFRFLAPTRLRWTGAMLALFAATSAAFCFEFLCPDAGPTHQLYGHASAVAAIGLLGAAVGPRLLRW